MTAEVLHPEALLDRELEARLTRDESERLQQHLQQCDACRLERALRQSIDFPLDLREEQLAERAAERAADLFLQRARPHRRFPIATLRWGILAASLALVGLGFAAGAGGWPASLLRLVTASAPVRPPVAPRSASSSRARVAPSAGPLPLAVSATSEAERQVPEPQASSLGPDAALPTNVDRQLDGPFELYTRANRARRQNQSEAAARLYRELQTKFPESGEALVSRVTFGRLLLDRLSQPSGALAEFDRYLRAVPRGGLREEALIGKALALRGLGRAAEEQTAWRLLLKEFPDSMYAERARARLAP